MTKPNQFEEIFENAMGCQVAIVAIWLDERISLKVKYKIINNIFYQNVYASGIENLGFMTPKAHSLDSDKRSNEHFEIPRCVAEFITHPDHIQEYLYGEKFYQLFFDCRRTFKVGRKEGSDSKKNTKTNNNGEKKLMRISYERWEGFEFVDNKGNKVDVDIRNIVNQEWADFQDKHMRAS
jgi:hypothetical protein